MGLHEHRTVKRMKVRILSLCLALGFWPWIPSASPAGSEAFFFSQPTRPIKISTNLVTVPVSVTDAEGSMVPDLGIEDFRIKEDGRTETISKLVQAGESPLQLVLIFDLSGSIHSNFEFERTAASRFIDTVLKPKDTVSIISVSNKPIVQLESSSSPTEALEVLSALHPTEDATAFFDSIVLAADLLNRSTAPSSRQATVIFSDGEDNRSDHGFSDALDAMKHSSAVVYAINPSGPSIRLNEISRMGQGWLASFAQKTGGTVFVSDRTEDLDAVYERIAFELRAQYLLSYYSSNTLADGTFRNISVSLPDKPSLNVRARQGYYAVEMTSELRK
jgi:Ca-activated chloride channel family protein